MGSTGALGVSADLDSVNRKLVADVRLLNLRELITLYRFTTQMAELKMVSNLNNKLFLLFVVHCFSSSRGMDSCCFALVSQF